MIAKTIILFLHFTISSVGFAKIVEVSLHEYDIIFFDEKEVYFDSDEKFVVNKRELSEFFLHHCAVGLEENGVPWTGNGDNNISKIFHTVLNTFLYDKEVYYIKYF